MYQKLVLSREWNRFPLVPLLRLTTQWRNTPTAWVIWYIYICIQTDVGPCRCVQREQRFDFNFQLFFYFSFFELNFDYYYGFLFWFAKYGIYILQLTSTITCHPCKMACTFYWRKVKSSTNILVPVPVPPPLSPFPHFSTICCLILRLIFCYPKLRYVLMACLQWDSLIVLHAPTAFLPTFPTKKCALIDPRLIELSLCSLRGGQVVRSPVTEAEPGAQSQGGHGSYAAADGLPGGIG